jgi:hypothetical protein
MRVLRTKKFLVVLAAFIVAGVVAAVAVPAVISRQVFAEGSGVQYQFARSVSDAGGFDSGWHIHPGIVIFQVEAGSVQIYQGSCTPRTLGPGETYIEVPWKPIRAVAPGSAVWTTSIFTPAGSELSIPLTRYSPTQANPCP